MDFSDYQRTILNKCGYFALSLQFLHKNKRRDISMFSIDKSSVIARISFILTFVNSLLKFMYWLYLVHSQYSDLEFLDKITTLLYFLIFCIMSVSYSIWLFRYPLYEIIYQGWVVEEAIFNSLKCPQEIKSKIDQGHKRTVYVHLAITWIGCVCFLIQYYATPKYYTFTYALFDAENSILWTLFGIHEFLFMLHAWNLMTGSNSMFTFQGIAISNLISAMTIAIKNMYKETAKEKRFEKHMGKLIKNSAGIHQILFQYKQLMLINTQYNNFMSYKMIFLHACGYCQFISDVFLAVQVMRLPGARIGDIWFYIEDSLASMYMIYRIYNCVSHVQPASEEFFCTVVYVSRYASTSERKVVQNHKNPETFVDKLGTLSNKTGNCAKCNANLIKLLYLRCTVVNIT